MRLTIIALAVLLALMTPVLAGPAADGEYRLVEDVTGRFWLRAEWEQAAVRSVAKSYGYLTPAGDRAAAVWRQYDDQGAVARETFIMDGAIALRDVGRYFPALAADLTAVDEVFVIRGYRRDGLAVLLPHPDGERLVTFIMADGADPTRPNSHSMVRGYTVARPTPGERQQWRLAVRGGDGRDDRWVKVENFFRPGLHFSEQLVKRRHTDLIVVHHTKIEAMSVTSIHDHHLRNGWAGFGYHKVILADGSVADGRPEAMVGAHAIGVNRRSVGVVVVGDFDVRAPSTAQMTALIDLVAALAVKYRVGSAQVVGHRDVFDKTTCPGRQFPWDEFQRALRLKLGE